MATSETGGRALTSMQGFKEAVKEAVKDAFKEAIKEAVDR